jgi:serine/threonine protein kinase/tetratricopeptide (TPR) repeat protein
MIGKTISHYKIIEKLGSGGMGVVYKAQDTKLDRFVALKFLPQNLNQAEEEKQRFIHEAKAASALDHHNICTIHEIDEAADGQLFIAMALYEGQTLDETIEDGPLKLYAAVDIAVQISEGLAKAHEKEIVHRDLKPANVMLTQDGVVKLLDFGLAKLGGLSKLTKEGTTLGTAAYMSPEQARGEIVDQRTDIFSLGVLLYEMITGQQPFKGDYEQAVTYSILHEDPEPITGLRTGVPMELERIVNKCLQKEPSDRYQGANELLVDLRQITKAADSKQGHSATSTLPKVRNLRKVLLAGAVLSIVILAAVWYSFFRSRDSQLVAERKMLVVLPFENLGPPEQAYFAAGMTEEITSRLAAISGLGVISRSGAARYDRTGKTIKEIANDFGVDYVLDGTVRWNPGADGDNKVRITPELIGISDDTQLWSERYDRVIDDIFVVQSEIAAQVVQKLGVTLLAHDRQIIEAKPTENLEAYDYYVRGNDYKARRMNKKDAVKAIQMYEKAVDLDPNFGVAYAALSRACMWLRWQFGQQEQLPKAKQAIEKAQQLAPDLAETHMAWGWYYYWGSRDYNKAMKHFTIIQGRQPNDAEAMFAIGSINYRQGNWEQAVVHREKALELDPQNHDWLSSLGQIYLFMRRYAEAERHLNRAIFLAPDIPDTYIHKYHLYLSWLGSTERAERVLEQATGRIDREVLDKKMWALGRITVGSDTLACYLDKAETHYYMKQAEQAALYADSARVILEANVEAQPTRHEWHEWLGWAYAYQSRHADAIREARKAVELLPVSKDAFGGCRMLQSLALLYTVVGEHDAAIGEQLRLVCMHFTFSTTSRLE